MRLDAGLSPAAAELATATGRRVLAPIALFSGLATATGAVIHAIWLPEHFRPWALVLHLCLACCGLWWWKHPPRDIWPAMFAVGVYLNVMIASIVLVGKTAAMLHFGLTVAGLFYLNLDRRWMLAQLLVWLGAVAVSAAASLPSAQAVSTLIVLLLCFAGSALLRLTRLRALEELVETRAALERASTEREAAQERALRAEKLESLGVMAAGVAHDYNNLLVGVVGGLDLADMAEDEAEREEAIAMVRSATQALQVLSRQLLDVAGGRPMALSAIDLNALVQASIATLRMDPSHRERVRFSLDPETPRVLGAKAALGQVCMNLVGNALRVASDAPGAVEIGTAPHPDGGALLWVEDDGPGVPEAQRSRIFDPFFTTREDGRGLGLATVQAALRAHGAEIELSHPRRGARFEIHLAPAGEMPEAPVAPAPIEASGSRTVLVVDDEPAVRRVVVRLLERLGFETLEAATGDEALALQAMHVPGLFAAVVDERLAGASGLDVAEGLRENSPELLLVLCSGQPSSAAALREAGLTQRVATLAKPFSREALARVLDGRTHTDFGEAAGG